jgi:hypothetical protein
MVMALGKPAGHSRFFAEKQDHKEAGTAKQGTEQSL